MKVLNFINTKIKLLILLSLIMATALFLSFTPSVSAQQETVTKPVVQPDSSLSEMGETNGHEVDLNIDEGAVEDTQVAESDNSGFIIYGVAGLITIVFIFLFAKNFLLKKP